MSVWITGNRGLGDLVSYMWNSFSCCCLFDLKELLGKLRQFIIGQYMYDLLSDLSVERADTSI